MFLYYPAKILKGIKKPAINRKEYRFVHTKAEYNPRLKPWLHDERCDSLRTETDSPVSINSVLQDF